MIVRVRLFARARDLAGTDVLRVELPDGAAVADLRRRLAADHPALAPLLERSAIAVENEFAADSLLLSPGAEIALLPPVSGGQFPSERSGVGWPSQAVRKAAGRTAWEDHPTGPAPLPR